MRSNLGAVRSGHAAGILDAILPFIHFHWTVLENIKFSACDTAWIARHVHITGMDRVRRVRESRTGAIHLTSHIGNWEMGARVTALCGIPLTMVALGEDYQRMRAAKGLQVAYAGKNAARAALETLRAGNHLAMVFDLPPNDRGLRVQWCGRPAQVARGPFWLAEHALAPIIPTFCIRQGMGKFALHFEEPIFPEQPDFVPKTVARMEHFQRRFWSQWSLFTPLVSGNGN